MFSDILISWSGVALDLNKLISDSKWWHGLIFKIIII